MRKNSQTVMKTSGQSRALAVRLLGFSGAFLMAASCINAVEIADAAVLEEELQPGTEFDISYIKQATDLCIKKAGSYTLSGQSGNVRVKIQTKGSVKLYFVDGLNIDPATSSWFGNALSVAAIEVGDYGGTVELISKAGATSFFGSYGEAPAIAKDENKTRLYFKTEDPSNPGTIHAKCGSVSHAAAIGSYPYLLGGNGTVGKIYIEDGAVIADGGVDAAGIGGGLGKDCVGNITINGGVVTATGYKGGAGIGAGQGGTVTGAITVNGGSVTSTSTGHAAGIGGGAFQSSDEGDVKLVKITGGYVEAKSEKSGAGIGSGGGCDVERIVITGGTVRASSGDSEGSGIGSGGSSTGGTCSNIEISGGDIEARGGKNGGTGIGSSQVGAGKTNISISGGQVRAYSGKKGYDIGGGGRSSIQSTGHMNLTITGGTVWCNDRNNRNNHGIGSRWGTTITVSGGSLRCMDPDGKVYNKEGVRVYMTCVELTRAMAGLKVSEITLDGMRYDGKTSSFAADDIWTIDGDEYVSELYLWLPLQASVKSVTASGITYDGEVKTRVGSGVLQAVSLPSIGGGDASEDKPSQDKAQPSALLKANADMIALTRINGKSFKIKAKKGAMTSIAAKSASGKKVKYSGNKSKRFKVSKTGKVKALKKLTKGKKYSLNLTATCGSQKKAIKLAIKAK